MKGLSDSIKQETQQHNTTNYKLKLPFYLDYYLDACHRQTNIFAKRLKPLNVAMATAGTLSGRVLVVLYEPRQAEVGDLAHQAVPHQDVGRAQVPVDVVHPLDVRHARRHLHERSRYPSVHPQTAVR
jgi:hypothetical protein